MSNETNNVQVTVQNNGEVMTNNAKYYQQQPANSNGSDSSPDNFVNIQGIVSNCVKLNVRSEAQKKKDNVLCIVSAGDVLLIDKEQSTNAWFYVTTASGISGYCMKEFVAVE